jgi:hypothetical protein
VKFKRRKEIWKKIRKAVAKSEELKVIHKKQRRKMKE